MKTFRSLTTLFVIILTFSTLFNSCSNEDEPTLNSDVVPKNILEDAKQWFQTQTNEPGTFSMRAQNKKVLKPIWDEAKVKQMGGGRFVIIAPAKIFVLNNQKVSVERGFIFSGEDGKIKDADLVEFYGATEYISANRTNLLERLVTDQIDDFNGSIIFYDVNYKYKSGFEYKNGKSTGAKVRLKGKTNEGKNKFSAGRTMDCYDVYHVTYYTNGYEYWDYMYSYCDGDGSSENPGGGGNGEGAPQEGDTRIETDPNGQENLMEYKCFENGACAWVTVLITLPTATVEADRETYSFIPLYPIHNQVAYSAADAFVYVYNSSNGTWSGETTLVVGSDDHATPIEDIENHLRCFNPNSFARVTVFVDQPVHNSTQLNVGRNVGHVFLSIQQNGITRTVGFYPADSATPFDPEDAGQLRDNAGKAWDVSVGFDVSSDELGNLLNYIENQTPETYNINTFNCTNWVVAGFAAMGIALPQNTVTYPWPAPEGSGGLAPSRFGQDMRGLLLHGRSYTVSYPWQTGSAGSNAGNCP